MNREELRGLLGGYATGSLTASERHALLEAALDDQELFNALQNEQALKELLADPVSRAEVRLALEEAGPRTNKWWSRGWTWGLAGALACGLMAVVLLQQRPAVREETQSAKVERAAVPAPRPPSAPAEPAPTRNSIAPEAPPMANAPAAASAPMMAAAKLNDQATTAPLHYQIEKRSANGSYAVLDAGDMLQPGDAVRFLVTARNPGGLALERLDGLDNWVRIFPSGATLNVAANREYVIPDAPIDVQDQPLRLRLVLARAGESQRAEGRIAPLRSKAQQAVSDATQPAADITVEITLAPLVR